MTYVSGFGNEGTGLHSHCDFGWQPGQWYTHVIRRWYAGGDKTFIAYFIYDQTKKEWSQYVTFAVPEENAMLHGDPSGFLENFANDKKRSRTSVYKSYWKLTGEGKWIKPKRLEANAGEGNWKAAAYGNDGIVLTACGKEIVNGKKFSLPVTSVNEKPAILKPAEVYDLSAYYDGKAKNLYVNWSLKSSAAPQLAYEIKVYDTKENIKAPVAVMKGFGPEVREAILSSQELALDKKSYYIVLNVKDIFNQEAASKTFELEGLKP